MGQTQSTATKKDADCSTESTGPKNVHGQRRVRDLRRHARLTSGRKWPTQGHSNNNNCAKSTFCQADASLRRDVDLATNNNNSKLAATIWSTKDDEELLDDGADCEKLVRKLSNVSSRNIQLLALSSRPLIASGSGRGGGCSNNNAYACNKGTIRMSPYHEALASELRTRRRSSLINMVLGSPKAGPRFSDDLCSMDSRLSELCSFGIEFPPEPTVITSSNRQQQQQRQHNHKRHSFNNSGNNKINAWGKQTAPPNDKVCMVCAQPNQRPSSKCACNEQRASSSSASSSSSSSTLATCCPSSSAITTTTATLNEPPLNTVAKHNGDDDENKSDAVNLAAPRAVVSHGPPTDAGSDTGVGTREPSTSYVGVVKPPPPTSSCQATITRLMSNENNDSYNHLSSDSACCDTATTTSTSAHPLAALARASPSLPVRTDETRDRLPSMLMFKDQSDDNPENTSTLELKYLSSVNPPHAFNGEHHVVESSESLITEEQKLAEIAKIDGHQERDENVTHECVWAGSLAPVCHNESLGGAKNRQVPTNECLQQRRAMFQGRSVAMSAEPMASIDLTGSFEFCCNYYYCFQEDEQHTVSHSADEADQISAHSVCLGQTQLYAHDKCSYHQSGPLRGQYSCSNNDSAQQGAPCNKCIGCCSSCHHPSLVTEKQLATDGRHISNSSAASSLRRCGSELSLYGCFGFTSSCRRRRQSYSSDIHQTSGLISDISSSSDVKGDHYHQHCQHDIKARSNKFARSLRLRRQTAANFEPSYTTTDRHLIKRTNVGAHGYTPSTPPVFHGLPTPAETLLRNKSRSSRHRISTIGSDRGIAGKDVNNTSAEVATSLLRQTKLTIMFQVCLPFILAGFGNMAAGLAFSTMSQWRAFHEVPTFFVLLPSFVGMKGNIEMTLASRLSTLSNLNLLTTSYQKRQAYVSNLMLMLCHAIGLSTFATFASVVCGYLIEGADFSSHSPTSQQQHTLNQTINTTWSADQHQITSIQQNSAGSSAVLHQAALIVLPCALITSVILVFISSIVVWWTVWLANKIQVNPDNLSTLVAALYGDVTCVLTYGLFAHWLHSVYIDGAHAWPIIIISLSMITMIVVTWASFQFEETHQLVISSMPPTLISIIVSLGSGAILSLVLDRFQRMALYQPVVNGFGANLIAAQASRISTWLWCRTLRKMSTVKRTDKHQRQQQQRDDTDKQDGMMLGTDKRFQHFQFEPTSMVVPSHDKKTSSLLSSLFNQPWPKLNNKEARKNIVESVKNWLSSIVKKLLQIYKYLLAIVQLPFWSFCNSTPNSTAAKLLLITIIPAHTLYFVVIWMLSPQNHVVITWQFYLVYMALCFVQVFILLSICEPMMRFLMKYNMDPDVFGIALLMSLADLIGTLCLTGGFQFLAKIGDANALTTSSTVV